MLDFLSDYTRLREQNKDSELPLGTGLIQGFQPSRGLKSAFKVSSIFVPFTLLLQVSDRMHLVDSGQTVAVWRWHRNRDVSGTQGRPIPIFSLAQWWMFRAHVKALTKRETETLSWILHSPVLCSLRKCKMSGAAQWANAEPVQHNHPWNTDRE